MNIGFADFVPVFLCVGNVKVKVLGLRLLEKCTFRKVTSRRRN